MADLGCSINRIKTFDIITNAKFVFLNFVLGEGGGGLQPGIAMLQFASGLCAKILKHEPLK